jgi:plastocyanin
MRGLRLAILTAVSFGLTHSAFAQTTVEVGYNGTAVALAFRDATSGSTSSVGNAAVTRIHEGDTIQFNWRGNFHNIAPYDTTNRNAGANVPVTSSAMMSSSTWNGSTRSSTYQCTNHAGPMTGQVFVFEVARSLGVSTPSSAVVAGRPFSITVTATGQTGTTDALYQGTVQFSSSDPNSSVMLPTSYTFVPADNGTHIFNGLVLRTPTASATITVSDTTNGLSGQVTVRVDADTQKPRPPENLRVQ